MRALIIVDLQNDFLPGGALAVPRGEEVIPVINALQRQCEVVIASKDWHPVGHESFRRWTPHCIQGTWGAEFPQALFQERIERVFLKGQDIDREDLSAFREMEPYLIERGVQELWIVGLALDYCVLATALEAARAGWKSAVIPEGCRAIGSVEPVIAQIQRAGITIYRPETMEAS